MMAKSVALFVAERGKFNQALMDFVEAKAVVQRN